MKRKQQNASDRSTQSPQKGSGFAEVRWTTRVLIGWLNESETDARKRVKTIIERSQAALSGGSEELRALDSEITRYRWRDHAAYKAGNRLFIVQTTDQPEFEEAEAFAVRMVLSLAQEGKVGRLKQCELRTPTQSCSAWFYAEQAKQRFCSTPHQQLFNREKPGAKERNRAYQHDYYHHPVNKKGRRTK